MFPIHNESGKVIAFGGRAMNDEDQPLFAGESLAMLAVVTIGGAYAVLAYVAQDAVAEDIPSDALEREACQGRPPPAWTRPEAASTPQCGIGQGTHEHPKS